MPICQFSGYASLRQTTSFYLLRRSHPLNHFLPKRETRYLHQQVGKNSTTSLSRPPKNRLLSIFTRQNTSLDHEQYPRSFPLELTIKDWATASNTALTMSQEPTIHSIFETKTGTWQYIVADPSTLTAVIIDSVLDYDPTTRTITSQTADTLLAIISQNDYKIDRILETHAHADHLTAAAYLQHQLAKQQGRRRPPICIGKRITQVQRLFGGRYGVPPDEYEGVFDMLLEDDEMFEVGSLKVTAMHLPGHTPDHMGYKIGDNVFCGDTLFHTTLGTARCDFPGGDAQHLYSSAQKLLSLPPNVKIWTGHDYPSAERGAPVAWLSVQEHKDRNKHLKDGTKEQEYVALRKERDAVLAEPKLLGEALQVNIRGGKLPKSKEGRKFLMVPLKVAAEEW